MGLNIEGVLKNVSSPHGKSPFHQLLYHHHISFSLLQYYDYGAEMTRHLCPVEFLAGLEH